MSKYYKMIGFILLGITTIAGLAGSVDLAVAGLAIYFTGKELQ